MTEIRYIYNIVLIIIYSVVLSLSVNHALRSDGESSRHKKILFLLVGLYFLFFIFDNLIISMTEFIAEFGIHYNRTSLGLSTAKTIIFLVNNFCQLCIITHMKEKKLQIFQYVLLLLVFLWMLIPFSSASPMRVFLYYLPNQFLLMYTGFLAKIDTGRLRENIRFYLNKLSIICFVFGFLIILEDLYVIFHIDSYNVLNLKIQNRSYSEDFFSIAVSVLILHYFINYQSTKQQKLDSEISVCSNQSYFFDYYHLTEREREICELVLQHKHNQEIASKLFLSIGTVKTHIHNIFLKMDISKRDQIFELFDTFQKKD